ncbi:MAG: DUF1028 domain-containing protein [Pseudomonadota bacterium]
MSRFTLLGMLAAMVGTFGSTSVHATFSIVACDEQTQSCGVAVATHNLAVGNSVPFAEAGVGAGVSQFETNPQHGPHILDALRSGANAEAALETAMKQDNAFDDGAGLDFRQIGVVSIDGSSAAYSGSEASPFSGFIAQGGVTVQGNGLASASVLSAMLLQFNASDEPLAERLLGALEAGYAEGGQTIGVTSAALYVATPEGWPVDVDLRVDFAPATAIDELRVMHDASVARTLLFRARRHLARDEKGRAAKMLDRALILAPDWDRIWLGAARLSAEMNDSKDASARYRRFAELNPTWAEMLDNEIKSAQQIQE